MASKMKFQAKSITVSMPITQTESMAHTLIGANYTAVNNWADTDVHKIVPAQLEKGDECDQTSGR